MKVKAEQHNTERSVSGLNKKNSLLIIILFLFYKLKVPALSVHSTMHVINWVLYTTLKPANLHLKVTFMII